MQAMLAILPKVVMLAMAGWSPLAPAASTVVTRMVNPGGTGSTATIVAGQSVTFELRIDASTVSTIGTAYRLSQTTPSSSGWFSIGARSVAGSPFGDPSGGTPDAAVIASPASLLDPDSNLNLGNNAIGLAGIAPAVNVRVTTITLASSGQTPAGTYRIQPTSGVSFATEITTSPAGSDVSMSDAYFDIVVAPFTINASVSGSGSGSIVSVPPGISCPPTCSASFAATPSVTLNALPANSNSLFTGWLGSCTGGSACVVGAAVAASVNGTFAPNSPFSLRLDVDENGSYDALSDGLLILRALFGLTGNALASNALGAGSPFATLPPAALLAHIGDIRPLFDVDGNGQVDALTDGLMLLRYLFGLRGDAMIAQAIGAGATRRTAAQIESYIRGLLP